MCTVIAFKKNTLFFGRNMDIEYDFGQKIAFMPREFVYHTKREGALLKHYAMIGAARVEDGVPLYAEACNEKGLCMAGLNFPGNAVYADEAEKGKIQLAPYEIIPYVLGKCADVEEAKALLKNTEIIKVQYKPALPLAPLHWIVADKNSSIVVERTERGLEIFDNPYGVLTNNPPFAKQKENVSICRELSVKNPENYFGKELPQEYLCEGVGAIGLPGDFSSRSRFIKALFCKENSVCGDSEKQCVAQVFRILDSVAMVRGTVITQNGLPDLTTYSCCIDAQNGVYYYKTYDSFAVNAVRMDKDNLNSEKVIVSEMI